MPWARKIPVRLWLDQTTATTVAISCEARSVASAFPANIYCCISSQVVGKHPRNVASEASRRNLQKFAAQNVTFEGVGEDAGEDFSNVCH